MKNNVWVTATIQACHEILYFLPVLILLNHSLVQTELAVAAVGILICYLLGFALGKIVMIRILEWLLCWIIAIIVSVTMIGLNWHGAAFVVLTTIAVIRGYRFRYASWDVLFPNNVYMSCIVLYFVTPVLFMFYPDLKIYSTYLYWAGLYCLIHVLFTVNSKQLELAAQNNQAGQSVARNVLRVNRFGTAVIVIVLFVMINIDRLLQMMRSWIIVIFDWINRLLSKPKPDETARVLSAENTGGLQMDPPKEKSALGEFIDMLFYYAAYVVVFIAAIGILYFIIFKVLIPLFSRFITNAKLTRELEIGVSDEEEKLEAPHIGQWFREMIKRRPSMPVPADNKERVRFVYRETLQAAIKRGLEFQKSHTPLEIERDWQAQKSKHRLPTRLMTLYNKARYGESKISDEEMKHLNDVD